MNRALFLTVVAVVTLVAVPALFASSATAAMTAQAAAQKMWAAFLKGDLKTFAKYSHPVVVKKNRGEEKLITLLKKGTDEMKSHGVSFESVKIDQPQQTVRAGKELHAILPMQIVMKRPDARIRTKSYLIGVSVDDGRSWSFIDGSRINPQTVRKVLPNFNDALKLPSVAPPEKLD